MQTSVPFRKRIIATARASSPPHLPPTKLPIQTNPLSSPRCFVPCLEQQRWLFSLVKGMPTQHQHPTPTSKVWCCRSRCTKNAWQSPPIGAALPLLDGKDKKQVRLLRYLVASFEDRKLSDPAWEKPVACGCCCLPCPPATKTESSVFGTSVTVFSPVHCTPPNMRCKDV